MTRWAVAASNKAYLSLAWQQSGEDPAHPGGVFSFQQAINNINRMGMEADKCHLQGFSLGDKVILLIARVI
jgi:hypothetical protein